MSDFTVRIHNADTGEIIDREMTKAEITAHELNIAKMQKKVAEAEAKIQAKSELLERLGITEDEAKLLLA